ncbi:MAG: hypothetical protein LBE12_01620 [Planctomycetaceae bacterium]|nr:hypothetical protein [Planctomycetaceae bacterium]
MIVESIACDLQVQVFPLKIHLRHSPLSTIISPLQGFRVWGRFDRRCSEAQPTVMHISSLQD